MSTPSDFIISIGREQRPSEQVFPWFSLWKIRLAPYHELQKDSLLYWYDPGTKDVFLKTSVLSAARCQYSTEAQAREWLKQHWGSDPTDDPYFKDVVKGFCLAFTVQRLEPLTLAKPSDFRFPMNGWLKCDSVNAKRWLTQQPNGGDYEPNPTKSITTPIDTGQGGSPRQTDPLLRCKVEEAAIKETIVRFEDDDEYKVVSQEKDNVGWDLFATRGTDQLRLEVKGLSGNELCVELTPNEFAQMKRWRDSYRVCIVVNALTDPQLAVFAYSPESGTWQDDQKRTLQIDEVIAARCHAL